MYEEALRDYETVQKLDPSQRRYYNLGGSLYLIEFFLYFEKFLD